MIPAPIRLAREGPPVLALGGYFKTAVCVTRGDKAFLSQCAGDLDTAAARRAFDDSVQGLLDALDVEPEIVAHDLHPDFYSTRFGMQFAQRRGQHIVGVQHHHAHIAAVAAEHRIDAPLLGLALDGFGLGTDGGAWGGELLRLRHGAADRIGHLRELLMPGGDRAAREPWRMAAAVLHALKRTGEIPARLPHPAARTVATMLERGFNSPATSSAGRWFDAAAGLLGVRDVCQFEAQAAIELENLAANHGPVPPMVDGFHIEADGTLDLLPLMSRLCELRDPGYGAALFHSTLALALARWICAAARSEAIGSVALGGGCFMNRILAAGLRERIDSEGLRVFEAKRAPANDGGLALGQAAVALATLETAAEGA